MKNSRGTALVSVLFVVAVVAMLSTAAVSRLRQTIEYSLWGLRADDLLLSLQGVKYWGIAKLLDTQNVQGAPTSKTADIFLLPPTTMGPLQYHQITITGTIQDQQGLWDINRIWTHPDEWSRLLNGVDPKISFLQAFTIRQELINGRQHLGTLPLFDVTELLTVPSMPTALYRKLKPYLTASGNIDDSVLLNINSTSAPVLVAMLPALNLQQAQILVNCVKARGPFLDLPSFKKACRPPEDWPDSRFSTSSRLFVVSGMAVSGLQQRQIRCLLQSSLSNQNKLRVTVLWQALT